MKIVLVVGARPNFMKVAPIIRAINKHNASTRSTHIEPTLVHTGQHYDYEMSQIFFKDLELPQPDIYLGVDSGTHAEQTGKIMIELEKVLFKERPHLVIVVGDVNSTLAAALAAVKLCIPVAHVEAGLRSYDRTMPEEINRLLTDAISDYLFTPSPDADENLKKEGIPQEKIFFVGNVMVDSLLCNKARAEQSQILSQLKLAEKGYALVTLHRPTNVDEKDSLLRIIEALREITRRLPVVFPAHPRTRKNIAKFEFSQILEDRRILLIEPLGYLDFVNLEMNAKFVMTDSGGIQEETTVLSIPCLTLRNTTERPITLTRGTNILVWNHTEKIVEEAFKILDGKGKTGNCPELWDGKTAERIIKVLAKGEGT
ncbi:MAG: UDP-N-acetylglucosamine 2-epimerase (non-hydrolyzing) [Dehalococcoidia bacterium]